MSSSKQIAIGLLACLVAALHTARAADSWTPIVSKLRRTVTAIPPEGPPMVTEAWDGVFLRTVDGSRLEELKRNQPEPSAMTGLFVDRPKGKVYELVYATKTAVLEENVQSSSRSDSLAISQRLSDSGRESEVVLGIVCFVVPIQDNMPGGSGTACYSPEYDLQLYFEVDVPDGAGGVTRHRQEHYDLEIGRAPPPGAVARPEGFVTQGNLN